MQLGLGLAEPPCPCCDGEREVEPPYPGMDPEPCAWCDEPAWWRWMADPYAQFRSDYVARQARPEYDWFRRPAAHGQLGLGIGNRREPAKVTRA